MLARAVRVATIRGIEVRLDPSLVVLAVLLAWLLTTRFTPLYGTSVSWTLAASGTVLFFASILVHELGHALEAHHRDIPVKGITLLLFGGVTEMHTESQHPRDEFVIAAVGPYISLVAAAAFHVVGSVARAGFPTEVGAPIAELAMLLAYLNLLLAAFNLVPGAPLDGGRVLRAGLWWVTKDRRRAVRISARCGQAFGAVLVVFGVYEFALGLELAAIGGIWWIVIGAFLFVAARSELRRNDVQTALAGHTAADAVGSLPPVVAATTPLDEVAEPDVGTDHVLVTDLHGEVTGWIPAGDLVGRRPAGPREATTAGGLAAPIGDVPTVTLDEPLTDVVAAFVAGARRLRVVDGPVTVAVLTERQTAGALRQLGIGGPGRGRGWVRGRGQRPGTDGEDRSPRPEAVR